MRSRPAGPAIVGVLCCLAACLGAGPSHVRNRHRRVAHARRLVTAADVRAARLRKTRARAKLHQLASHVHHLRAKIHAADHKARVITTDIHAIESRIRVTRARIEVVHARLNRLGQEHQVTANRLTETRKSLAFHQRLLAARVRANYERDEATYAGVLIASRSLTELLSRGYYVRQIVHSDTDLIEGVRREEAQIDADKRLIERQQQQKLQLQAQNEAEKLRYADEVGQRRIALNEVRQQRASAQTELDITEADVAELTATIRQAERLQAERDAELRAGNRHWRPEQSFPAWHGGFVRPCYGRITSGFGMRFHPILHVWRMHTGVDIGAPYGTAIHAAAGGRVLVAGWSRGYGNLVVLDHGNSLTTVYGHCSALLVSPGEYVRQGQVIARVGATGLATGPHLHFEVRRNGLPVRPF